MKKLLFLLTQIYTEKVSDHLEEANKQLIIGEYQKALDSFDLAIGIFEFYYLELEPKNFISYFKRANAYIKLGKLKSALSDFSTIIELKPDYEKAFLHRAKLNLNLGYYKDSIKDLKVIKDASIIKDAQSLLDIANKIKKDIPHIQTKIENKRLDEAIELLADVLNHMPHSSHFRTMRANLRLMNGQFQEAQTDLTKITRLDPSDENSQYGLAVLNYYVFNDSELALKNIKKLLHYDPENKKFTTLFKTVKKTDREIKGVNELVKGKKWRVILEKLEEDNGLFQQIDTVLKDLLKEVNTDIQIKGKLKGSLMASACLAHSRLRHKNKIISTCTEAIESNDQDEKSYVARSEGYLILEEYESAVNDLNKANELSGGKNNLIKEKLKKAKELFKKSKQRDYYKILGVSRDATNKEIKKAFNKLARQWHPDKYKGDLSTEQVQNKMSELNLAYEVLSNKESRDKFDQGIDPNDPHGGQNPFEGGFHGGFHGFPGGGDPFAHFFQQGGGGGGQGGQQFSFNFGF